MNYFATNTLTLQILLVLAQLSRFAFGAPNEPGICPGPNDPPPDPTPASRACTLLKYVGVNDLGINDIVVKSAHDETSCIKARFSLAIKVEDVGSPEQEVEEEGERFILGYQPLDMVVGVKNSCPETQTSTTTVAPADSAGESQTGSGSDLKDELSMTVKFECGELTFNFKRNDSFYVSAIRGIVWLDSNTKGEFVAERPMFFTSDLTHHFKFTELIEVNSTSASRGFRLTANFYNSEFETFRKTNSRSFVMPPDEKSQPFERPEGGGGGEGGEIKDSDRL